MIFLAHDQGILSCVFPGEGGSAVVPVGSLQGSVVSSEPSLRSREKLFELAVVISSSVALVVLDGSSGVGVEEE